jgi:hypothetical protein
MTCHGLGAQERGGKKKCRVAPFGPARASGMQNTHPAATTGTQETRMTGGGVGALCGSSFPTRSESSRQGRDRSIGSAEDKFRSDPQRWETRPGVAVPRSQREGTTRSDWDKCRRRHKNRKIRMAAASIRGGGNDRQPLQNRKMPGFPTQIAGTPGKSNRDAEGAPHKPGAPLGPG